MTKIQFKPNKEEEKFAKENQAKERTSMHFVSRFTHPKWGPHAFKNCTSNLIFRFGIYLEEKWGQVEEWEATKGV